MKVRILLPLMLAGFGLAMAQAAPVENKGLSRDQIEQNEALERARASSQQSRSSLQARLKARESACLYVFGHM